MPQSHSPLSRCTSSHIQSIAFCNYQYFCNCSEFDCAQYLHDLISRWIAPLVLEMERKSFLPKPCSISPILETEVRCVVGQLVDSRSFRFWWSDVEVSKTWHLFTRLAYRSAIRCIPWISTIGAIQQGMDAKRTRANCQCGDGLTSLIGIVLILLMILRVIGVREQTPSLTSSTIPGERTRTWPKWRTDMH